MGVSISNYVNVGKLQGKATMKGVESYAFGNDIRTNTAQILNDMKKQQEKFNQIMGAASTAYKTYDVIANDTLGLNDDSNDIYDMVKERYDEKMDLLDDKLGKDKIEVNGGYEILGDEMDDTRFMETSEYNKYKSERDNLSKFKPTKSIGGDHWWNIDTKYKIGDTEMDETQFRTLDSYLKMKDQYDYIKAFTNFDLGGTNGNR